MPLRVTLVSPVFCRVTLLVAVVCKAKLGKVKDDGESWTSALAEFFCPAPARETEATELAEFVVMVREAVALPVAFGVKDKV